MNSVQINAILQLDIKGKNMDNSYDLTLGDNTMATRTDSK